MTFSIRSTSIYSTNLLKIPYFLTTLSIFFSKNMGSNPGTSFFKLPLPLLLPSVKKVLALGRDEAERKHYLMLPGLEPRTTRGKVSHISSGLLKL